MEKLLFGPCQGHFWTILGLCVDQLHMKMMREGETNQHQSEQLDMFEISPVVKQMLFEGEGYFPRHEFLYHHTSKLSYITDNFVKLLRENLAKSQTSTYIFM